MEVCCDATPNVGSAAQCTSSDIDLIFAKVKLNSAARKIRSHPPPFMAAVLPFMEATMAVALATMAATLTRMAVGGGSYQQFMDGLKQCAAKVC
eukprot:1782492-Rhodomonas_salina.4